MEKENFLQRQINKQYLRQLIPRSQRLSWTDAMLKQVPSSETLVMPETKPQDFTKLLIFSKRAELSLVKYASCIVL